MARETEIQIRVSREEKDLIKAAAEKHDLTVSDWLRKYLLTPQMVVVPPGVKPEAGYTKPEDQAASTEGHADEIEKLTLEIFHREGLPMSTARREARKRLGS